MKELQTTRAVYREGRLIFPTPGTAPKNGAQVVVTYVHEAAESQGSGEDPIVALRGRGKGEGLVRRLLRSRRQDRERE